MTDYNSIGLVGILSLATLLPFSLRAERALLNSLLFFIDTQRHWLTAGAIQYDFEWHITTLNCFCHVACCPAEL